MRRCNVELLIESNKPGYCKELVNENDIRSIIVQK
jgi:hypothetical protein